ncbi:hypothetical protein ACH41H_09690 [Streptomyces sp. NPDC020800]|uniref:hypothetical protein n=1 Tax=Streptomyces sp. NPDC020800 TaxID=3365092 RepID=UPI00378A775F
MRQTLSKGLVVAAAATTALSLSGTWASADSGSPAAAGAPALVASDLGALGALGKPDALEPTFGDDSSAHGVASASSSAIAQSTAKKGHRAAPTATATATPTPSKPTDGSSCGCNGESQPPSYGEDKPPSYGEDKPPSYGEDEPPSYGDESPTPPPTKTPAPPKTTPPATPTPVAPSTPPAAPTPVVSTPPQMASTGAGDVLGGVAASAALLAAGTVLFRRGRAGSHR